jgi:diguanylate cyclase (GGDEF)-like protein
MDPSSTVSRALADSLKGARVLIVDDEPLHCEAVAALVRGWNIVPYAATTFLEALRLFKEVSPDLVLLDVMIPQVDGYKLAGLFKRDTRFVPIIMLTALDNIESKRRGLNAGADEFLTKPVNGLELQIRISSMIRIKRLAEALETANRQLAELATVDPLTGIANRRLLDQRLTYEYQRYKRYGRAMSVAMVDIDHFKNVNDTFGHAIGDKVLTLVGQTLRVVTRATDLVGRYGGEEFMVIAPETSMEHSRVLAERIRSILSRRSAEPEAQALGLPPITVSVGVASTDLNVGSQEELVKRSDKALYRAKREGRDRVVIAEA